MSDAVETWNKCSYATPPIAGSYRLSAERGFGYVCYNFIFRNLSTHYLSFFDLTIKYLARIFHPLVVQTHHQDPFMRKLLSNSLANGLHHVLEG